MTDLDAVVFCDFRLKTFGQVIEADISDSEEKSITALGLLNTMETILTVMEDQKEVC